VAQRPRGLHRWGVQAFLFTVLGHATYVAMVLLLGAGGTGLPISQDLVLLVGGVLSARGVTSFWPTVAAAFAGVLLGDSLMFRWGRKLGPRAYEQRWVRRVLTEEREARLREHFARHGALTVMAARHTPLVRAVAFFLAGASGVRGWKFLLADAASALFTVPLWVWLGRLAGEHLDQMRARIHHVEWLLAAAVALAALVILLWRRRRLAQAR
jgi:membrane protein DedA with SNARE-associated domain